ncbi:MAG: hypothetical protein AB1601_04235 [Planctomycetota bacterium]
MTSPPRSSVGRTVTLLVLGLLLVTVCATVYVFLARHRYPGPAIGVITSEEELERAAAEARRLATLLTILLISGLLILLYVIGAYLVIRVGQAVSRQKVGGRATRYVDAWAGYRLTDEEISAATTEDHERDERPPDPEDGPPLDRPSSEE